MSEPVIDPNDSARWLCNQGIEVSPLGEAVAHILGRVYMGIHNAPINLRKETARAAFAEERCADIVVSGQLATVDFDDLTRLVIMCHDLGVRCEICGISGGGPGYMRLSFHMRDRLGNTYSSHPTMEQAVDAFRSRGSWQKVQKDALEVTEGPK